MRSIIALLLTLQTATAGELWLGSRTHPLPQRQSILDAAEMFSPGAPWSEVAARTSVVEIGPGDVAQAEDGALAAAFAALKQRHIALSLNMALLQDTDACRARNEAYFRDVGQMMRIVDKVKRDGGEPRYIAMDEPFFFANRWTGAGACHETAEAVAARIRDNVALVRRVFPHVQIGDIEVVDGSREWTEAVAAWVDTYRRVTGEKLAFLQTDTNWSRSAVRNLATLAGEMRARDVPFGVIYTAESTAASDTDWTDSSLRHLAELEGPMGLHPDQQIVQSWVDHPSHALPETQDGTLTNVALRMLRPAPDLRLEQASGVLVGRLRDASGKPVAGARIALEALDDGTGAPVLHDIEGIVPANAARAVIALRAGNEGSCVCQGPVRVRIGPIGYSEQGAAQVVTDPGALAVLSLAPGAPRDVDIRTIAVTPGAAYRLASYLGVPPAGDHAGYIAVIFRDAANKGLGRGILWFQPANKTLGTVVTDAAGRFRVPPGHSAVRATYLGDARSHPAMAEFGAPG